jgi:hypothetical protein
MAMSIFFFLVFFAAFAACCSGVIFPPIQWIEQNQNNDTPKPFRAMNGSMNILLIIQNSRESVENKKGAEAPDFVFCLRNALPSPAVGTADLGRWHCRHGTLVG